jgi:hypothetical protein
MKQTRLYIFITSDIPDPYINAIAHCGSYYKELTQVTLIEILGDRRRVGQKKEHLNRLRQDIKDQLKGLSSAKYLSLKDNARTWVDVRIEESDRIIYAGLAEISIDVTVWIYDDLKTEVANLLNSRGSFEYVFDVSAVLKSQLVDVYVVLRSENISAIHSFELITGRSYDDRDLIHNRIFGETYKYPSLTESLHTKDIVVESVNSITSKESLIQVIDIAATEFAKFCLFIYFLIGLPLLILIGWYIIPPEGWSRAEPIFFLVTLSFTLLSYLFQIFFSGKFPSLDPRELFNVLKNWKKNRLENSKFDRKNTL